MPHLRTLCLAAILGAGTVSPAVGQAPPVLPEVPEIPGEAEVQEGPASPPAGRDGPPVLPDVPEMPAGAEGPEGGSAEGTADPGSPFQFKIASTGFLTSYRDPAVPVGPPGPDWADRLDLRMFGHPSLSDRVGLLANLRLRTRFADGEDYELDEDSHLDVQELALDVRATDWLNLEAGRINIRSGVATGFNPTDWFKVDSLVVADTFDTMDRRDDRLGTVVAQGIWHNDDLVLALGYRPEFDTEPDHWLTDGKVMGLGLDRTNADTAFFAKLTPLGSTNLSATFHVFYEPDQPGAGVELSMAVSETVVVFGEWSAQYRYNLVDESSRRTPLPDTVRRALGGSGHRGLQNQLAVGATWSLPFGWVGNEDVTLTAEYHFNQAGLSAGEVAEWFDAGRSGAASPSALWAVRSNASRRQEPLTEHQLFFRFAWTDLWDDADFSTIAFVSPQDGSALIQADLDIDVLDDLQLGVSAYVAAGGKDSVFGSQPSDFGAKLSLTYAF